MTAISKQKTALDRIQALEKEIELKKHELKLIKSSLGAFMSLEYDIPLSKIIDILFEVVTVDHPVTLFKVDCFDIVGTSRIKHIAETRHVFCFCLRKITNITYKHIGKMLGNRDHTTILYSCQRINDLMDVDTEMRNLVDKILDLSLDKIRNYRQLIDLKDEAN